MLNMFPLNGLKMAFLYALLAAAVVDLERTFYQVSEDVCVVEVVCAIVYSTKIAYPIAFPFDVRLKTLDSSAGKEHDKITINKIYYTPIYLFSSVSYGL